MFLPLFYQVSTLFLIIVIGYILNRLQILDDRLINGLTRLVLDVTLPALIIVSMGFEFSREIFRESLLLFALSLAFYLSSWLLAVGVTRLRNMSPSSTDVTQFMLTFPNVGFMGMPIMLAVYGKLGVFYTSICTLTFGLVIWTLGVWIFRRREKEGMEFRWQTLLTPGIIATLIGYLFFIFSIRLPVPIEETLQLLGNTTTPLSMLLVGGLLGRSAIREMWSNAQLYLLSIIRLLILPLVVWLTLLPFSFSSTMLGALVILIGMPAAANTAIFAARYDGDAELGSKLVFMSTLLSVVTIPGVVFLLQLAITP